MEVPCDLQRSPEVGELAPPLLQFFVVDAGDLSPKASRRHVDEETFANAFRTNPRHVEGSYPVLPDEVLRKLGILRNAQRRGEVIARPGGQDTQGDTGGETGPADTINHVVDRAVSPSDDEQALAPLLSGPYRILRVLSLDPVKLYSVELFTDLIGVVGAASGGRVADYPCSCLLHGAPPVAFTTLLVYP